ncbi:hypothetical protein GALL_444240 [mine drainage metagenome]|uniref:Uncharacterized protein n=1 Tax=mine drainage metagenome TaxID=410659 RepID=A0A1J5QD94_9ZZZZ
MLAWPDMPTWLPSSLTLPPTPVALEASREHALSVLSPSSTISPPCTDSPVALITPVLLTTRSSAFFTCPALRATLWLAWMLPLLPMLA